MSVESPVLTIDQAAEYLGGISVRTLRSDEYKRLIPSVPITRRRVGYLKASLDRYLAEREEGSREQ